MNFSNRRPARDPDAPRRNMTAYLLYQNAMRETFKQQVKHGIKVRFLFLRSLLSPHL
jgi:hypothetical protein